MGLTVFKKIKTVCCRILAGLVFLTVSGGFFLIWLGGLLDNYVQPPTVTINYDCSQVIESPGRFPETVAEECHIIMSTRQ
jgi:hypothetical protein